MHAGSGSFIIIIKYIILFFYSFIRGMRTRDNDIRADDDAFEFICFIDSFWVEGVWMIQRGLQSQTTQQ